MEIYEAKNINKEDIDNIVKVISNKFEENKSKKFGFNTPTITLNNIKFMFRIECYKDIINNEEKETWLLNHMILSDAYLMFSENNGSRRNNTTYFSSNTLRELIVKYTNSKFVYDKCYNEIMRYEDYLEIECVRKLFHTNNECCVCYDNIAEDIKTKCNHYLCVECYKQIKGKKRCPMCKSCLCCGEQGECDGDEDEDD